MFNQPQFWKTINVIALLLWPIAVLYRIISKLRYSLQLPIQYKPKIICIGNATVGGSGKTPLAIAIGKVLLDLKVDGRKLKLAFACKDVSAIDEALLLSKVAPTFSAARRVDAIKAASDVADVVIADDGLQNNSFHKDLSILAVPSDQSFGNEMIFPAGPMRETLCDSLNKSDLVFLMNERGASHVRVRNILAQHFDKTKVFSTIYTYTLYERMEQVSARSSSFRNKRFLAFCGIANSDRFFEALEENGFKVLGRVVFPDHYRYNEHDLLKLAERASALAASLIATEKDFIKLDAQWQNKVAYLKLDVCILNQP